MFTASDLPETVPVFPLPGALLLPRSRLPLHIFEPRYLAMIDDTLKTTHRLIGMIQPRDVKVEGGPSLHAIGCAGRLTGVFRDRGRTLYDHAFRHLTVSGQARRGRWVHALSSSVDVSWTGFDRDLGPSGRRSGGFEPGDVFFPTVAARSSIPRNCGRIGSRLKDAEDELLINSLSMLCPFEPEDKQALVGGPIVGDAARDVGYPD